MTKARQRGRQAAAALLGLVAALLVASSAVAERPFARTETREDCAHYDALKQPFFGDLHIHTSLSQDSFISSQRNGPDAAYRYARGESIVLPDAQARQNTRARIGRPIDFAAVTDHAEYFGEMNLCTTDPARLAWWWPHCVLTRASNLWVQLVAINWWGKLGGRGGGRERSFVCTLGDCESAAADTWGTIQAAAEAAYDRSSRCSFTTFVAYEFTDAPDSSNMHRNVIFRNQHVLEKPISVYDTGPMGFVRLWEKLREKCIEGDQGCDVLAIPHNPNLSRGLMFRDPLTPEEADERLFFEPIVELIQHKASSECRFDRRAGRGLQTKDELCDFEQAGTDNLTMLANVNGEMRSETGMPVAIESFPPRNMVRNALKDGLALGQQSGTNPFRMGFIGSTDTHSATAGGTEEANFVGHIGRRDAGYRKIQDHIVSNPGGLAVIWAEENSRDALFAALRRREAYATSGSRPIVRFFGGSRLPLDLCDQPDSIARAYDKGTPMGGMLEATKEATAPRFLVSALKDSGTPTHPGLDLARAQIIKGWVDASGVTHERVHDVATSGHQGAWVDEDTCAPVGRGAASLCTIWQDPDFDPAQPAFYYLRVLENPSCRWSTHTCMAAGVNPFAGDCTAQANLASARARDEENATGEAFANCCLDPADEAFYSPVIQERAWTSPIWWEPLPAAPLEPARQNKKRG